MTTQANSKSIRARLATLAALGIIYPTVGFGAALCATTMLSGMAHAAEAPALIQVTKTQSEPISFQKKTFSLKGSVSIEQRGDQTVLVFSDNFRTKNGPDLKLFLSKNSVDQATGDNATSDAVRLGVLKSNRGAQEYVLPEGVTLSDYASLLVHCEAYSKLWGGADLT